MDDSYLGDGGVNLLTDRSQERALSFAAVLPDGSRKLTHFRKAGAGSPMWSGQCVYDVTGYTPDVSTYDTPDPYGQIDDGLSYHVRGGVVTNRNLQDADEYTTTRIPRVSAHFDSSPAARFFQGFANLHWSGMMAGFRPQIQPRPLTQNMNPAAFGSKELHKSTQYKPFPPMGSIVSSYGVGAGKAL